MATYVTGLVRPDSVPYTPHFAEGVQLLMEKETGGGLPWWEGEGWGVVWLSPQGGLLGAAVLTSFSADLRLRYLTALVRDRDVTPRGSGAVLLREALRAETGPVLATYEDAVADFYEREGFVTVGAAPTREAGMWRGLWMPPALIAAAGPFPVPDPFR